MSEGRRVEDSGRSSRQNVNGEGVSVDKEGGRGEVVCMWVFFFFSAEGGIRGAGESRGRGDVYEREGGCVGVCVCVCQCLCLCLCLCLCVVSYIHLSLPTTLYVYIFGVAVSVSKKNITYCLP